MGYSPWGPEESDGTERLALPLFTLGQREMNLDSASLFLVAVDVFCFASLMVIGRDISRQMDGVCLCVCVCVCVCVSECGREGGMAVLGMRTVWGNSPSYTV